MQEVITWKLPVEEMPDEELTLLIRSGSNVGEGFLEEGEWRWACGMQVSGAVDAWAEMPSGPVLTTTTAKRRVTA